MLNNVVFNFLLNVLYNNDVLFCQEMCASIGVDPLASGKGFWSNMLEIGDFYYELAVQIVEVRIEEKNKTVPTQVYLNIQPIYDVTLC